MRLAELRDYQVEFEKTRESLKFDYVKINELRKQFLKDYPIHSIVKLKKDEYVIGKGGSTFCNRMENELNNWGNIHGSPAVKFGLYFGKYGEDKTQKYRIGRKEYGTDINMAFAKILYAIVELLDNKDNYAVLKKNPISPMFKGKILSVYYPNEFLNIFSANHLNYYINCLGLDNDSKSELDKQFLLLNFKKEDLVMKKWSVYEYSRFLYHSFGRPNDEFKDDNIDLELRGYKPKDFPPIEKLKIDFVDLQINTWPDNNKRVTKSKTDYDTQSKRNKRIGDRGEQIALRAERQYLKKSGKDELAGLIDHIAKRDDSAGYDIISFDADGRKKYIEVKSTQREIGHSKVYLSANEIEVALKEANYYFYIIYEVGSKSPKIWKIKGSTLLGDANIVKEPILYKLKINTG